mmetsp:Transcript_135667/g.235457  ORF Transcript_135667/g.235457 Transcript_135667/m.235457 type:complete len:138 (-) Transcript_135667:500-913(-)
MEATPNRRSACTLTSMSIDLADVKTGLAEMCTTSPQCTIAEKDKLSMQAVTTLEPQNLAAHTPAALSINFMMTPPATMLRAQQSPGNMTCTKLTIDCWTVLPCGAFGCATGRGPKEAFGVMGEEHGEIAELSDLRCV